jgi:hypothetical protein
MIRKKLKGKKKNYWPSKLTPRGQFHPIHEIQEKEKREKKKAQG